MSEARRRGGPWTAVMVLGSNIEPRSNVPAALEELRRRLTVTATSSIYETEPVGAPAAPVFWNAAVAVATRRAPAALKWEVLRPLEAELGRVRGDDPNAPRTLDLDLVLYGSLMLRDPTNGLEIPDPDLTEHAHLALPAADVAPDLRHPITGRTLADHAAAFRGVGGVRVVEAP